MIHPPPPHRSVCAHLAIYTPIQYSLCNLHTLKTLRLSLLLHSLICGVLPTSSLSLHMADSEVELDTDSS